MKRKIYWTSDCTAVVRRILKMMNNGTKVVYLPGNHDDSIQSLLPFEFGAELKCEREVVHTTAQG